MSDIQFDRGSGNVFADLDLPDADMLPTKARAKANPKSYWFYYLEPCDGKTNLIRVRANKKPKESGPGIWRPVQELRVGKWDMACFPEITWGVLKTLRYIGKERIGS